MKYHEILPRFLNSLEVKIHQKLCIFLYFLNIPVHNSPLENKASSKMKTFILTRQGGSNGGHHCFFWPYEAINTKSCKQLRVFFHYFLFLGADSKVVMRGKIGHERGSGGSVRADIKSGRSYALQDAFYKANW